MALSTRLRQEDEKICIDIWVGDEGVSELDFDVTIANFTTNTWNAASFELPTSLAPLEVTPAFPPIAAVQSGEGANLAILEIRMDVLAGKVFPKKQWVTIFKGKVTSPVAGESDGTATLNNLTKSEDAAGVSISSTTTLDSTLTIKFLTATESAGVTTLTQVASAAGLASDSATTFADSDDSLLRRHFGDYDPSRDVPIVNANLPQNEFRTLLDAGLIRQGTGVNANRLLLTEAGKRALGYSV